MALPQHFDMLSAGGQAFATRFLQSFGKGGELKQAAQSLTQPKRQIYNTHFQ